MAITLNDKIIAIHILQHPLVEMYTIAEAESVGEPVKKGTSTAYKFRDDSELVIQYNGVTIKHDGDEIFYPYLEGGMMQ